MNLSKTVRERLLSRFTAWKKRIVESTPESQNDAPIGIEIKAGYKSPPAISTTQTVNKENSEISTVFKGQIALVEPISGPPDIATRITAFTRQVDRSSFKSMQSPARTTLRGFVEWINSQLKLDQAPVIDTIKENEVLLNPGTSMVNLQSLVVFLQGLYGADVYAYIDDGQLIVKDAWKIVDRNSIPELNEFVDTPLWNEYGVTFRNLYDPRIKLAGGVKLKSVLNPAVNGDYVIYIIEYQLTSRDVPFYVTGYGSPAGNDS